MKPLRVLWVFVLLALVVLATVQHAPSSGSWDDVVRLMSPRSSVQVYVPTPARPTPPPVVCPSPTPWPSVSRPGAWTPAQAARLEALRRHIIGVSPALQTIRSRGFLYRVPQGGWVTSWHLPLPNLRVCVLHPYTMPRHSVVGCADFWTPYWGPGWSGEPYGFYFDNFFWYGVWSGPVYWPDYLDVTLYVFAPISQVEVGRLAGGFRSDAQVEQAMLRTMALPSESDPTSGLYQGGKGFAPVAPGPRLRATAAYNLLRRGRTVYYHPAGGAFERMDTLNDLHTYLYTPESRQLAPLQDPDRGSP